MRILQCLTSIDPALGGSVEATRQVAVGLASQGLDVDVLSVADIEQHWLESWPIQVHALAEARSYYCYSKRLVPWLRAHSHEYDAVVVNGVWRYTDYGVWQALRGGKTPYFLFTHGMLDPWFQRAYPFKHLKKSVYWRLAEHKVLQDARAVCFTSEEERILARSSFRPYACREHVTGFGIYPPPSQSAIQLREFYGRYPGLAGKRVVLSLGRIHRKKGVDLLVAAFAALCHSDDALHLVIAGPDDDGWRPKLEGIAAQSGVNHRITWTGQLQGDAKWGAFRGADVFILPSHSENYGIVVAEALACGLPVLVSNKVNTWREIEACGAGLIQPDDLPGTVQLLKQWLALSDAARNQMRLRAKQCFADRFSMGMFLQRFVAFLASELNNANGDAIEVSKKASA